MPIPTIYQFNLLNLAGKPSNLADFRGKVMLIVNTATRCGLNGQYAVLEWLYQRYAAQGFVVLAFPCNQFAHQEPGDAATIERVCRVDYALSFPIFAKIDVRGRTAHPLYRYLCAQAPGLWRSKAIKWNFTKFLINRQGFVVKRFAPLTHPKRLIPFIEALL